MKKIYFLLLSIFLYFNLSQNIFIPNSSVHQTPFGCCSAVYNVISSVTFYESVHNVDLLYGFILNLPPSLNFIIHFHQYIFHISSIVLSLLLSITLYIVYLCYNRQRKLKEEFYKISTEQALLVIDLEQTIQELENSKEEIHEHNLFIKRLSTIIVHDLQSPFRFLIAGSEAMYKKVVHKNDYEELEVLSREIKNSGKKTLQFVNEFGLWVKSIDKDYKVKLEGVNISNLLDDLNSFFWEIMNLKMIKLDYSEIDKDICLLSDRELLKVILRNLIDNASKHSSGGNINVSLQKGDEAYEIRIEDNGEGMSIESLNHIRSLIKSTKDRNNYFNTDEKQGYKLIAHFSKLLNIELVVNSTPDQNTVVILKNLKRII